MKEQHLIKLSTFFPSLRTFFNKVIIRQWKNNGSPEPSPHAHKQETIKAYARQFNLNTLVETGTYLGDMMVAQAQNFRRLYSIELSDELAKRAQIRLSKYKHITILQGDSGKVLHELMPTFNEPCLLWLDGHYSAGITAKGEKECPVFEELDAIMHHPQHHIVLIDDARLFIGKNDYPTLEELMEYVKRAPKKYVMSVSEDIIRIIPA